MKRGSKRVNSAGESHPATRRRLRDAEEEAEETARRRKAEETTKSDDDWEDDSEAAEDDYADIPFAAAAEEEEEIIDAEDEDYAEFQREAADLADGMRRVTFDGAEEEAEEETAPAIWRSDQTDSTAGGPLVYANRAYDSFFQLRMEYPCLSFDVLRDATPTTRYPLSFTLVCGSQADAAAQNKLYLLRVSNVCRTKHDLDSEEDSEGSYIGDGEGSAAGDAPDEDDDAEEANNGEPIVHHRTVSHYGTANRVRGARHESGLVAVWSDAGHVQVFDLADDALALTEPAVWARAHTTAPRRAPLLFCTPAATHRAEGYGLDWSPVARGTFASGDCAGGLFVWRPADDGRWRAAASSTAGGASVEEIQWSPTQADVLLAARAGGAVEVWDTRDMRGPRLQWRADATDINVADWNRARQASHLLVTGADSGAVAVWDLRRAANAEGEHRPIQRLPWHTGSITAVEFAPHNESVLAVTGDDGQCTLWDLSLERDPSEEKEVIGELFGRPDLSGIPDQLMFQHQGLEHPKEVHWHMQIPGMVITTDYQGLHLFRPMNWRSLMK